MKARITGDEESLSYVDVDGNWCVYGAGFGDGLGGNTRAFSES